MFGVGSYFLNSQIIERSGTSEVFERSSDSGRKIRAHFCPKCGSTVYWEPEFLEGQTGVAVGCFASDEFPAPAFVAWNASRHQWVRFPDHCLTSDTQDFGPG